MKTNLKIFILTVFTLSNIWAQEMQFLPKNLTQEERSLLTNFQYNRSQLSAPPSTPVRTAAEWEEVEYLVLSWQPSFQNILRQIVAVAVNECKVIIATQNQTSVANYLTSNGISLTNVIFINQPTNSIWIRDFAGNTIYSNDVGERALTDWIYNRPRPFDDALPSAHATTIGIPIYITNSGVNDLVNTGGNFMSDGLGNAFASELILEENAPGNPYNVSAKTEAQIDDIMFNYMGIDNYIKMPTLPYDEIHHIDMHMKLLDEETLLVSKYPEGVADGPQIEANIEYVLNNFTSHFGTPYKVHWIDAPPSTSGSYPDTGGLYRTYSNSVIVNKSILVPVYRPQVDAPALALYRELMPGYNVVGIDVDNSSENLIASLGAIHCITHTIGVADPLLIVHQPIESANANSEISINAMVKHQSGILSATLFWREEGATTFNELPMSWVSGDNWTATLAISNSGNNIEYYIRGKANSGKELNRPLVAPDGFWTIDVQTLSISDWAKNNISQPYPNPVDEYVSFQLNQINSEVKISIFNPLGQLLASQQISNPDGVVTLHLLPNWSGTLFVRFEGDFGSVVRKMVKR